MLLGQAPAKADGVIAHHQVQVGPLRQPIEQAIAHGSAHQGGIGGQGRPGDRPAIGLQPLPEHFGGGPGGQGQRPSRACQGGLQRTLPRCQWRRHRP